ncbi:iron-containing alcohol dehydrogenase [Pseudobacillus sp. 179-B 2D1 NHS]|uniref:iron-containing alcohol dehydrogenase n=2 Tax=unclassified Pseudobacillus TaxID=2619284 RepID=UPI003879C8D5
MPWRFRAIGEGQPKSRWLPSYGNGFVVVSLLENFILEWLRMIKEVREFMPKQYSFISPIEIHFGEKSVQKLERIFRELKSKSVFLICDPVVLKLGLVKSVIDIVMRNNIAVKVCDQVEPEPSITLAQQFLDEIHQDRYDLVIGIGGGSALDLAKSVAVLAAHEGRAEEYLNLTQQRKISKKGIKKVLIPTTAGTGAEVTDIAVFSVNETKDVITHKYLLADYVIVDPELTYSLPQQATAASAVDAFTHAIESITSRFSNPLSNAFAKNALERIYQWIRVAVWNGDDRLARQQLSLGSLEAGLSFYNAGVAGVHALAYPLGGQFKVAHGEANAVLLPYVYANIWPSCVRQLAEVGQIIGSYSTGKSERENAKKVVQSLYDLVKDSGLPLSLSAYDVREKDLKNLTRHALLQERLLERSPKKLTEKDIYEIYTNAYTGRLILE